MLNNEGFSQENNYLEKLDNDAKKLLVKYREELKLSEKDLSLYEVKDEILSNMMGVLEMSGEPKPNLYGDKDKQRVLYYSKSNNKNRMDIIFYETTGNLFWNTYLFNKKRSTYELFVLHINPFLEFSTVEFSYLNVPLEEQKSQVDEFLVKNEGDPLTIDINKTSLFKKFLAKIEYRDEVLGKFIFDYPDNSND